MEKKLRAKLEDEVRELRAEQKEGVKANFPTGAETIEEFRRKFREAEEKVKNLKILCHIKSTVTVIITLEL